MDLHHMSDGRHDTRREDGRIVGAMSIERRADGKSLATFVMKQGAPGSYRFTCHPIDRQPFVISPIALDSRAEVLEVEPGTASAGLRRIRGCHIRG